MFFETLVASISGGSHDSAAIERGCSILTFRNLRFLPPPLESNVILKCVYINKDGNVISNSKELSLEWAGHPLDKKSDENARKIKEMDFFGSADSPDFGYNSDDEHILENNSDREKREINCFPWNLQRYYNTKWRTDSFKKVTVCEIPADGDNFFAYLRIHAFDRIDLKNDPRDIVNFITRFVSLSTGKRKGWIIDVRGNEGLRKTEF